MNGYLTKPFKLFQNTVQRTPTRMRHVACVHSSDDASRVKPRTRPRLGARAPSRTVPSDPNVDVLSPRLRQGGLGNLPNQSEIGQNDPKCDMCEQCAFICVHANSCQFMPIHANSCQFMPIHANSCQFMPIHANSCQFMPIHANSCQFMRICASSSCVMSNSVPRVLRRRSGAGRSHHSVS